MSMMLLVMIVMVGIGYLVLKKEREKMAAAGGGGGFLTPVSAQGSQQFNSQEEAIGSIESQLSSLGVSQNEINAYIDWLTSGQRSMSEIQRRVSAMVN